MVSNQELKELINSIKKKLDINQQQIADRIGYSRSYLSDAFKKNGDLSKLYRAIYNEFKIDLESLKKDIPGYKTEKKRTKIIDADNLIVHDLIIIKAILRVILRSMAELQAAQQKRTVTSILSELTKAVRDEIGDEFDEL